MKTAQRPSDAAVYIAKTRHGVQVSKHWTPGGVADAHHTRIICNKASSVPMCRYTRVLPCRSDEMQASRRDGPGLPETEMRKGHSWRGKAKHSQGKQAETSWWLDYYYCYYHTCKQKSRHYPEVHEQQRAGWLQLFMVERGVAMETGVIQTKQNRAPIARGHSKEQQVASSTTIMTKSCEREGKLCRQ